MLCTHRTTAPDRSDELTYAIADLYRLDGVRRLDLAGLSVEEVAQYLVAEGGLSARRAREYATVLRDQTGGNPFFLRELWRDLAGSDVFTGAGASGLPTRAFGAQRAGLRPGHAAAAAVPAGAGRARRGGDRGRPGGRR